MKSAQEKLNLMISGHWVAQVVSVFAKLGIADHLKDESMSASELAKKVDVHPESLFRTLRALETVEVVAQDPDGKFSLTEIGQLLRTDVEISLAAMAAMNGDPAHWLPWAKAEECIRTGNPVSEKALGEDFWSYLFKHQDQFDRFNNAMTDTSGKVSKVIATTYDFSSFSTIVDIGGGHGTLLRTILEHHTGSEGILFDLPKVIDSLPEKLKNSSRIKCVKGSFLDTAPEGGNLYIMKHIIHDWGDPECEKILGHIRKVIPDEGKVLVADMVLGAKGRIFPAWLDLNMMILLGGKERDKEQFSNLFKKSGFELTRIISTESHLSLIEGKPV